MASTFGSLEIAKSGMNKVHVVYNKKMAPFTAPFSA